MTEAVLLATLLVGTGAAFLLNMWHGQKRCPHSWRQAAEECLLADLHVTKSFFGSAALEGRSGKLIVRLERYNDGTRFVIEGLAPGQDLTLRLARADALQLGDEAFDVMIHTEGNATLAQAIFNAETRLRVRQLLTVGDRIVVSGARLQVDVPLPRERDPWSEGGYKVLEHDAVERLGTTLGRALAFAQRLARHDVVPRLVQNARLDPDVGVRHRNLLTLIRAYAERPEAREVLLAACDDENPQIRLEAARALGDDGIDTLLDLASCKWGDDSAAASAIVALGTRLPREHVQSTLGEALRSRHVETSRACLKVLGYHGGAEALETLTKVMLVEKRVLALEACRALGTMDRSAERPLVEALQGDVSELRLAAANALGHVGTVEAVVPLKEAEAEYRDDRELRVATRQAIAEIQSRLSGASPGQLSLTGDDAGRVSLVEDEAGLLSLPGDHEQP